MNHLPLFLDIKDRLVLVAGGGEAAARRVDMGGFGGKFGRRYRNRTCDPLIKSWRTIQ